MAVWAPGPDERPLRAEGARHALLLTEYGVDVEGTPYYIGKCSWTVDSWMNGYICVRRNIVSRFSVIEGDVFWRFEDN